MKIKKKELDNYIKVTVKEIKKQYGYQTRGQSLFKKEGDYFISNLIFATGIDQNLISVRGRVKPYFFDDIFWEVFHMAENSEQPMGLRANGAFAVWGLEIYNKEVKVGDYDEVRTYVSEMLRKCDAEIIDFIHKTGSDFKAFVDFSKTIVGPDIYDVALGEMLVNIKEKNYQEAKNIAKAEIKNGRHGNFQNEGKYIYEHIIDFCEQYKEV